MNRRRYIAGLGIALTATVAGCLEDDPAEDGNGNGTGDGTQNGDGNGNENENGDGNGNENENGDGNGNENGDDNGVGDGNGDGDKITEDPRIDEPPYEIEPQQWDGNGPPADDDWDEYYLCANMPAEPSLSFEQVRTRQEPLLSLSVDTSPAYAVRLLTSDEELEAVIDVEDSHDSDRLKEVDFDSEVVIAVESGFGSGSVQHHWQRVEDDDGVLHLHGCYTAPFERTDDYTSRQSTLVVERPDTLDFARVSLTVNEDRRVHFNSTEGTVTLDE